MRVLLFGAQVADIQPYVLDQESLEIVDADPEVVVCYGGDGTLLSAERAWPYVPKVPIRNSRRGNRCIAHPASDVLARLAQGQLVRAEYMKIECEVRRPGHPAPVLEATAMNEFSVHLVRIQSAVRFKLWLDGDPYGNDHEILGDGFVLSTPFGSTAYFKHITRGFFYAGIGMAFKSTSEHTNHFVVPEDTVIRVLITRGPALLAFDNFAEYFQIEEGDDLTLRRHDRPAVLLTWGPMRYPTDAF